MAVTITRRASLLKFDPSLVPPDGVEVVLPCAAPLKQLRKDAAGHAFHAIARRQSGLDKGTNCTPSSCLCAAYFWLVVWHMPLQAVCLSTRAC